MAEVVNSLFGITPESLMAKREEDLQAQAMQYAKMDPFQRATAGIYAGANKLGGAVGGLLGAQDPEMARLTQRQSLLKQTQPQDAAGWKTLAQQLYASGDTPGAQEALAKYQALQAAAIKQGLDTSTMASNLATAAGKQFDISPEGRGQELAKTGKFTSPSIKNFIEGKGELEAIDKFAKPDPDFVAKAVEFGFGEKPNYGGYSQEQAAKVNAALLAEDLKKKATGAPRTEVKVDMKGKTAFSERLGGKDADRVDAAITARESAVQQLDIADRIDALSPTALSGQFANTRVGMVNFLDTLGLTSPKDKQVLTSSQVLNADSGRLLLAAMNNKLGGGISNQDAKRFEQIFPQLENSPEARKELVAIIRRSAGNVIKESTALENYARNNDGLKGYKPTINLPGTNVRNPYSALSDAELEARIKRAQAAQR